MSPFDALDRCFDARKAVVIAGLAGRGRALAVASSSAGSCVIVCDAATTRGEETVALVQWEFQKPRRSSRSFNVRGHPPSQSAGSGGLFATASSRKTRGHSFGRTFPLRRAA